MSAPWFIPNVAPPAPVRTSSALRPTLRCRVIARLYHHWLNDAVPRVAASLLSHPILTSMFDP